ncbi:hypothetical protein OS493_038588 [Desmophyllum pertusum]|uniref:ABC transmembrane type-1 domain-containing protein n=1 Tax=Desmophyllum pertusum TaxID=174260 RepID=A0A9X0CNE1_9CNID|nr:hypothetical protein OS493_038588 [Desmophyllum pertusum]
MGCDASIHRYEKLDEKPDERKSFFGRLTFGFLSAIIQTGNKRPLEEADLSSLELESTRYLTEKLDNEWQNEMKIMTTRHHILAERSSAYVINLISKDMIHIHQAIANVASLQAPLEILVVFCLLWKLVGWQTFGGVVFSVILIAYQAALGGVFKMFQDKVVRLTDRRLRLIYDVISGIRVLKMNAWEWCFRDLVSGVRRSELSLVYKKGVILAGYLSAYSCYPIVSSFVSLFPVFNGWESAYCSECLRPLWPFSARFQKPVTILFAYEFPCAVSSSNDA